MNHTSDPAPVLLPRLAHVAHYALPISASATIAAFTSSCVVRLGWASITLALVGAVFMIVAFLAMVAHVPASCEACVNNPPRAADADTARSRAMMWVRHCGALTVNRFLNYAVRPIRSMPRGRISKRAVAKTAALLGIGFAVYLAGVFGVYLLIDDTPTGARRWVILPVLVATAMAFVIFNRHKRLAAWCPHCTSKRSTTAQ